MTPDYLGLNSHIKALNKSWAQMCAVSMVIFFILGLVAGGYLHHVLYHS